MTRIEVGDYESWKPMFDLDARGARTSALGHRLFRSIEHPNKVFIQVQFDATVEAAATRQWLAGSRVLDRFSGHSGPTVVEEAEAVARVGAPQH